MKQFSTIAINAFMELVRQPVFLLLMTTSASFGVFLAVAPYFGFGDDPKMVKDTVLAVMLVSGLFGAVLSASSSLAREIRTGTALAVLSKPVGRAPFLIAKFTGVAAALGLLTYANLLSALLASRMAYDAYGGVDSLALSIFASAMVVGYGLGGFTNYFLGRPFVADAVFLVSATMTAAFLAINFFDKTGKFQTYASGIDWRMVPASILILFALFILAAIALASSTRLETIPTLGICSAFFLLGLVSDYFFGTQAQKHWWASLLYTALPNWQLFWLADALEEKKSLPWGYVVHAFGYAAGYCGAALAFALCLFEDRELS